MQIRRSVLAALAAGVLTAVSAQAASAHQGPPPRFKACGPPITYGDDLSTTVTLSMLFPSSRRLEMDMVWLDLRNLGLVHLASGVIERWGTDPHAYNLWPQRNHWFHSAAFVHRGGWRDVRVKISPVPGRQSAIGGRFWVPSDVSACRVS